MTINWNLRYANESVPGRGHLKIESIDEFSKEPTFSGPPTTGNTDDRIFGFSGVAGSVYRRRKNTKNPFAGTEHADDFDKKISMWDRIKHPLIQEYHATRGATQPLYMAPQDLTLFVHPRFKNDAVFRRYSDIPTHDGSKLELPGIFAQFSKEENGKIGVAVLLNHQMPEDGSTPYILEHDPPSRAIADWPRLVHGKDYSFKPQPGWKVVELTQLKQDSSSYIGTHLGHDVLTVHHGSLPEGASEEFDRLEKSGEH